MDADRIIVMEDGRINGIGSHEELLKTNDIYRDVYESQMSERDFDKIDTDDGMNTVHPDNEYASQEPDEVMTGNGEGGEG
jgi:ABC-type hemin transport system ATPase subunit